MQSEKRQICPSCRRNSKPRLKVRELVGDKILVTEYCGYCRMPMASRKSTNEIEKIRRDMERLRFRIDHGESYLNDILISRINTYKKLLRDETS